VLQSQAKNWTGSVDDDASADVKLVLNCCCVAVFLSGSCCEDSKSAPHLKRPLLALLIANINSVGLTWPLKFLGFQTFRMNSLKLRYKSCLTVAESGIFYLEFLSDRFNKHRSLRGFTLLISCKIELAKSVCFKLLSPTQPG
jgi:hypothetical protein